MKTWYELLDETDSDSTNNNCGGHSLAQVQSHVYYIIIYN